jgi:hypothetical protein
VLKFDTNAVMPAFKHRRIYVASSGRNESLDDVLAQIRTAGHEAYDFRASGFRLQDLGGDPAHWSRAEFVAKLRYPAARAQFERNVAAIKACDALLVLPPCGISAHIELGYAAAKGKKTIVWLDESSKPELMYSVADCFVENTDGLLRVLDWPIDHRAAHIEGVSSSWLYPELAALLPPLERA